MKNYSRLPRAKMATVLEKSRRELEEGNLNSICPRAAGKSFADSPLLSVRERADCSSSMFRMLCGLWLSFPQDTQSNLKSFSFPPQRSTLQYFYIERKVESCSIVRESSGGLSRTLSWTGTHWGKCNQLAIILEEERFIKRPRRTT